jgi:hypothetical protein
VNTYTVLPVRHLEESVVMDYWQHVLDADLLKYRLSDMDLPTLRDARVMMKRFMYSTYFVSNGARLAAEFTLMNFTGKAAQVHFSMHPDNTFKESIEMGKLATDQILYEWKNTDRRDEPYLTSIFGLTPLPNRPACLFALKTGFKKAAVLPDGARYLGKICDGMISIKTREVTDG